MKAFIELIRPHQWIKNFFCFGGLFFGGRLPEGALLLKACLVFVIFCLVSSAVYIFNDIHDREADRHHPRKRERPLVRGALSVRSAGLLAMVLLLCGLGLIFLLGPGATPVFAGVAAYVLLNLGYTLGLKHVPLLDVNLIAVGFLIRVAAGALAIGVVPTAWILLCTYFLALLLAFGKRRAELCVLAGQGQGADGRGSRVALDGYTLETLDYGLLACAGLVIATYTLYCFFSHDRLMIMLTIVPVVVGTVRYLAIARKGSGAETPEHILLTDHLIQLDILVWAGLFAYVLYGEMLF